MVVIGGTGTVYGSIVGVAIYVLAMNYLSEALMAISAQLPPMPVVSAVLNAERWQLWLGLLFVLTLYYFPSGVAGHLRARARGRWATRATSPGGVTVARLPPG